MDIHAGYSLLSGSVLVLFPRSDWNDLFPLDDVLVNSTPFLFVAVGRATIDVTI